MARHIKFRLTLLALVICIVGFNFVKVDGLFYQNPFYILSFVIAIVLIVQSINYYCPNCKKNQVIRSFLSYKLPKERCYTCGSALDADRGNEN